MPAPSPHAAALRRGRSVRMLPPFAGSEAFVALGQSALGGLAVEAREVVARLVHHLDDLVVAHQVRAVRKRGVDVGVEGPGRGDGVALDAGDLHQSADGVARQSEVVFEPHLRGVFDLRGGAAEELAGGRRGHGAGDADLALAADLGPRDRRVGLGDVAEQSRRGQRAQDADAQEVARGGQVVEHRRDDAARSARRGRDHDAARGVLLRRGQRVGVDLGPRLERVGVALRLDPVGAGLAGDLQAAGQHAVVVEPLFDRAAHLCPDRVEVVPDFGPFAVVDILPVGLALVVAPLLDLGDPAHRVDVVRDVEPRRLVGQRPAADAVYLPFVDRPAVAQPLEEHAVGVERQHDLGLPDDLGRGQRFEHLFDGHIREVALARGGERSVERHAVGVDVVAARREAFRRLLGPHRVAARGAVADLVEFFERFHEMPFW